MIPIKPKDVKWTDEQWEAIYLSGTNIIVSAGAGSGKTAVLTERIIEKIKAGISINDMIILTFTNAAASEMRKRVRNKIIEAAKENPKLNKEIYLIDQAPITTYDAYSLALLKKYHYLLGISSDINIIDNALLNIQTKRILDSIIEDEYQNEDFLKVLDLYTSKDDEKIKNVIINIYHQINVLRDKKNYLDNYIDNYYSEEKVLESINEYISLINNKKNLVLTQFEMMKLLVTDDKLSEFLSKIEVYIEELNYETEYEKIKDIMVRYKTPNFPRNVDLEDEKENLKKYYESYKNSIEDLKSLLTYESTDEMKEEILSTKNVANVFVRIIKKLDSKLLDFKIENSVYEFSDITRLAIDLLKSNSDIRENIKNKTHEIMIDEYQDTNDINDYFISLISNNNVYMVGDVKQSIYRFRNANPKLFMEKYNSYKKGIGGKAIDLTKNFRSREEVLNNINEIFSLIMDEKIGGANYVDGHKMIYGNKKYSNEGKVNQDSNIEIYNYAYKDSNYEGIYTKEEVEAFIIANDIMDKVKNKYKVFDSDTNEISDVKYSDFAILLDRKSNFELFKKVFEYNGIPLVMHKDENFVNASEIYVIKNLLKLIYYVKEKMFDKINYSFISVARSYLFNFDDNDIFTSITNKDVLTNAKFKKLFDSIYTLVEKSKKESLSNLILDIYKEFDMYYKSITIGNVENVNSKLDYIYDVTCNLEKMGYSLKDYIDYFDNIYSNNLDIQFSNKKDITSNSVDIMSIHNSKGLEFKICYFPNLYKDFNQDDLKEKFSFSRDYGLIMPVFNEGLKDTIYKRLEKELYFKEDISERLRVLYVALTRTKEKMIMVGPINEQKEAIMPSNGLVVNDFERLNYRSFLDIILSIKPDINKYIGNIKYDNISKDYEKNLKVPYEKKIKLIDDKVKEELLENNRVLEIDNHFSHIRNKIEKIDKESGLNIHEILEYLDFKNYKEDINNYEINSFMKNKVLKLFDMPFMKNIDKAKIYKEYEFYQNNSKGIIDLLIEFDDKFIVVDYKLKDIDESYYLDQVNAYMDYIKQNSNKEVLGYLYSIIDERYIMVEN